MAMSELQAFMAAIRRLESGSFDGNYGAIGPYTGRMGNARGAYQIMSANWDSWAREAGIAGAYWGSKEAQDHVAEFKFRQYYERFGSWELVAVAWFGGPGAAARAQKNGLGSLSGQTDVIGAIDIPEYAQLIRQYMTADENPYRDIAAENTELPGTGKGLGGSGKRPAGDPMAAVFDPNADLAAYMAGIEGAAAQVSDPKAQMRERLTYIIDAMSNSIAGGSRTALPTVDAPTLAGAQDNLESAMRVDQAATALERDMRRDAADDAMRRELG